MRKDDEHEPPPAPCGICGYASEDSEPVGTDASKCTVCLDGTVDPWDMIREIREVASSAVADSPPKPRRRVPAADLFDKEWCLLEPSVRSIWVDLTDAELGSVQGSRQRFEDVLCSRYGYGKSLAHELTNGVRDLHDRFNGHWEIVRPCVSRRWGQLTRYEIDSLDGTITDLARLIEGRYELPYGEGRQQVTDFLNHIDFGVLVRLFGKAKGDQMGEGEATLLLQERMEGAAGKVSGI